MYGALLGSLNLRTPLLSSLVLDNEDNEDLQARKEDEDEEEDKDKDED